MATGFLRGAIAGAAGTTALNATTYLDMAVRATVAAVSVSTARDRARMLVST